MGDAPAEDHPVVGLLQHPGGGLEGVVVHRLDQALQVLPVPAGHFRQGPENVRGRFHELQFRVAAAGVAGFPQGVPELAEPLVAEPLGEAHHGADAHLRPLGHGLDAPQGPQQRVGHQGIGDPAHGLGKFTVRFGDAVLYSYEARVR